MGKLEIKWGWIPNLSAKQVRLLSWLFVFSVLLESSFLFVQVAKSYKTKSAEDLSIVALTILLIANLMWILMAIFVLRDWGVLISGILYVIGASMLIAAAYTYGEDKETEPENEE